MIIGLTGKAGSGRTTVARFLREQGFASLAFADPREAFVREVEVAGCAVWTCGYCNWIGEHPDHGEGGFTCPRCEAVEPAKRPVTAQLALQRLEEWGRALDPDVWARLGVRRAQGVLRVARGTAPLAVGSEPFLARLRCEVSFGGRVNLAGSYLSRDPSPRPPGVDPLPLIRGVVITDCRFPNEAAAIREAGGVIWRVERPDTFKALTMVNVPPKMARKVFDAAWRSHASETEQDGIEANVVLINDGTLDDLRAEVSNELLED